MARRIMTGERAIGMGTGEVGAGRRSGQRSATEMPSASGEMSAAMSAEMGAAMSAEMTAAEMTTAEVAAAAMAATAVATATMSTASASAGVSRARKRDGEYQHRQEIEL
jgi:hypothetical protein